MSRHCAVVLISVLLLGTVSSHEENTKIIDELKEEVAEIKEGHDTIKLSIKALHDSFLEQVEDAGDAETTRGQDTATTEPEDPISSVKVKEFVDRLDNLEKNIEAIESYVISERETDTFLRGLNGNIGKSFDDDMLKVKQLAASMKEELMDSLKTVDSDLSDVEKFANSRNVIIGGVQYYDGIGSACGSSFDVCRVENSYCRDGKCQCARGLSHDSLHEKCVEKCDHGYGNTYQTVNNYIIRGYNNAAFNETSLEECKERCETETSFSCRSFDYFPRWKSCYLSENVKGGAEDDAWEYNSAGIHFQRDCIVDKQ